jgi:hypothetical protein
MSMKWPPAAPARHAAVAAGIAAGLPARPDGGYAEKVVFMGKTATFRVQLRRMPAPGCADRSAHTGPRAGGDCCIATSSGRKIALIPALTALSILRYKAGRVARRSLQCVSDRATDNLGSK